MKHMTADEYEHELAKLRTRLDYSSRAAKKWYEKNRLLENAVRTTLEMGVWDDLELAIMYRPSLIDKLRRRVPIKPRKKWGWRL